MIFGHKFRLYKPLIIRFSTFLFKYYWKGKEGRVSKVMFLLLGHWSDFWSLAVCLLSLCYFFLLDPICILWVKSKKKSLTQVLKPIVLLSSNHQFQFHREKKCCAQRRGAFCNSWCYFIYSFPFEITFIVTKLHLFYKRLLFCTSDHVQNAVYPLNDNGSVNTAVTWVRIHTAVRQ